MQCGKVWRGGWIRTVALGAGAGPVEDLNHRHSWRLCLLDARACWFAPVLQSGLPVRFGGSCSASLWAPGSEGLSFQLLCDVLQARHLRRRGTCRYQRPGTRFGEKPRWFSLLLLFAGTVLAGWPSGERKEGIKEMFISPFGMVLVSLYVWVSASLELSVSV